MEAWSKLKTAPSEQVGPCLYSALEFNGLVARAETVFPDGGYLIAINIVEEQQVELQLLGDNCAVLMFMLCHGRTSDGIVREC